MPMVYNLEEKKFKGKALRGWEFIPKAGNIRKSGALSSAVEKKK